MGLIRTLQRKADTLYWRLRYWWFDTQGGAYARAGGLVLISLAMVEQSVRAVIAVNAPGPHVQHAYGIVVLIIVLLIIALAVYFASPKPPEQKPPMGSEPPSSEDGQPVIDILGRGWISDYFVLAWKPNGVEKIKAKGKK
jgi:hypothetical protein